jgi:hypothetical protein
MMTSTMMMCKFIFTGFLICQEWTEDLGVSVPDFPLPHRHYFLLELQQAQIATPLV